MRHLGDHRRDAVGTPPEHEWCDTARLAELLADPWSILLGRTMRPPRDVGGGCETHTRERESPRRDPGRS